MKSFSILSTFLFLTLQFFLGCIIVTEEEEVVYNNPPVILEVDIVCDSITLYDWYFWAFVDDADGYGDVDYVDVELYYGAEFEEAFVLDYIGYGEWEWEGEAEFADCDYFYDYEYCFYAEDLYGDFDEYCVSF